MFKRKPEEVALQVASEVSQLDQLTMSTLHGELPGFQIGEAVFDEQSTLEAIAAITRTVLPGFHFNRSSYTSQGLDTKNNTGMHFDIYIPGVAVHINQGPGEVILRSTSLGFYKKAIFGNMKNLNMENGARGPRHIGSLSVGQTVTVFAEDLHKQTGVAPALHLFKTSPRHIRHWTRYSYQP